MTKGFTMLFIFFGVSWIGCDDLKSAKLNVEGQAKAKTLKLIQDRSTYDFTKPEIIVLDKALIEISGLAYNSDKDVILTHNDEKGHVFEISKDDGEILKDYKFGKKGDYESVEYYRDKYVICNSSGNLHFYDPQAGDSEIFKTSLSGKNDVEGMCLSSDEKFLLLACKGQSNEESRSKKLKAVYAFDLESKMILQEPHIEIKDEDLESKVKQDHTEVSKSKLKKLISRCKDFSPSGIGVHPISKAYYLISARGSTVVVLDRNRTLSQVIFLDENIYKQPEGICFDNEANLYISLEGRGLSAKILKFKKL